MIDRSVERCFVDKYLEFGSSKIFARSVFFGSPSSSMDGYCEDKGHKHISLVGT